MKKNSWLVFVGGFVFAALVLFAFNRQSSEPSSSDESPRDENYTSSLTLLEQRYPQLKDFENQKSTAGQRIKYKAVDGTNYFAFITLGSGVPVTKALCYSVSPGNSIRSVGTFPSSIDSDIIYGDIDPVKCEGMNGTRHVK